MLTLRMTSFSDLTLDQVLLSRTTGVKFNPSAIAIAEFQFPDEQHSMATSIRWSMTLAALVVFEARHTWDAVKWHSELNLEIKNLFKDVNHDFFLVVLVPWIFDM